MHILITQKGEVLITQLSRTVYKYTHRYRTKLNGHVSGKPGLAFYLACLLSPSTLE